MVWEAFFFSSRRRHTRCGRDWSSDVCSSDLVEVSRDLAGKPIHLCDQAGDLLRRKGVPDLGELQREHVEERDLRREGLRGGDSHLDARTRIENRLYLLGDLGAHHVDRKST